MRKWKTNDAKFRGKIKSELKDAVRSQAAVKNEKGEATKVLGVRWNLEMDEMAIDFTKISILKHEPTQRGILRTLAAIYDPLGVVSPVSIIARVINHDVCTEGKGWDDAISEELLKRWQKWLKMIKEYPQIIFSRSMMAYPKEETIQIEMHGFANSSVKACCAVIYLVITQQSGVYARQLTAKSRVAKPKSTQARADWSTISDEDEGKCQISTYTGNHSKYCPTEINPADLGTRGTTPEKLQENLNWWRGPEWLTKQQDWPEQPIHFVSLAEEEEKQQKTAITMTTEIHSIGSCIDVNRYNSATKLFRVTSWVLRFIKNARRTSRKASEVLEAEEIEDAENFWMKEGQWCIHQARTRPDTHSRQRSGFCRTILCTRPKEAEEGLPDAIHLCDNTSSSFEVGQRHDCKDVQIKPKVLSSKKRNAYHDG
eukprot:gene6616-biopygen5388